MKESLRLNESEIKALPQMVNAEIPTGYRVLYAVVYGNDYLPVGLSEDFKWDPQTYYPRIIPDYLKESDELIVPTVLERIKATETDEVPEEESTKTDRLIHLITDSRGILFHDTVGNAMVAVNGDGSKILKIRSKEFYTWLSNQWWQKYRKGVGHNQIETAANTLEGMAIHEGKQIAMDTRVAAFEGDWFYDLGDGRVVKITETEWEIMSEPPILFYRFTHQRPQTNPRKENDSNAK